MVEISANRPNSSPEITSTPPTVATIGNLFTYQAAATDLDQDTVLWLLVSGPEGMAVDEFTGTYVWSPGTADLGVVDVEIQALDGHGGSAIQIFSMDVRVGNLAPKLEAPPQTLAFVGAAFIDQFRAIDPEEDAFGFELVTGPDGLNLSPSGRIEWMPNGAQVGLHTVEVILADEPRALQDLAIRSLWTATRRMRHPPSPVSPRFRQSQAFRTAIRFRPPIPRGLLSSTCCWRGRLE